MATPIGGYFELELRGGQHYHSAALRLNSARSCLEYILRARRYRKVYIPYFTCEIVLQPFQLLGIDTVFYSVDEQLEPSIMPQLNAGEAFLYTNYFGLKQDCVERLAKVYGSRLIVDNAQAFYAPALAGIDTYYSPRKFLGVPDGGYLYTTERLDEELEQSVSYDRMSHLLKRIELGAEAGYGDFKENDEALGKQPMLRMSKLTERLLVSIDYEHIAEIRRRNFLLLDSELKKSNLLHLSLGEESVPLVYPYLSKEHSLKQKLIDNKIFVATYWPNVLEWCGDGEWEHTLAESGCYLPIDQRCVEIDLENIITLTL